MSGTVKPSPPMTEERARAIAELAPNCFFILYEKDRHGDKLARHTNGRFKVKYVPDRFVDPLGYLDISIPDGVNFSHAFYNFFDIAVLRDLDSQLLGACIQSRVGGAVMPVWDFRIQTKDTSELASGVEAVLNQMLLRRIFWDECSGKMSVEEAQTAEQEQYRQDCDRLFDADGKPRMETELPDLDKLEN